MEGIFCRLCGDFPLAGTQKKTGTLGIVLKLKTERLELASYLKGLQFRASKTGKAYAPVSPPGPQN